MNPHGGEAARFSKPARRAVSGYLPYSVDRPGNRTPISSVQARHLPVGRAAHFLAEVRLGIEPSLPPYQSGVQPQHLQTKLKSVIPDGIEPSISWMSTRRLCRWTTGSVSTPTRSRTRNASLGPRHDVRFTTGAEERKPRDLNPHGLAAARFSKPARQPLSGYPP